MALAFHEKCYEVPVGFKYISAAMEKYDAIIGGESSGGLAVRGHIYGKDGIFAAMLLVEMLAVTGCNLSELLHQLYKEFGFAYHLGKLERTLAKADLLILDELSYLSFNRHQSELLFKVISDRSEKSSTIVETIPNFV